jgi:hypothetical protein
LLPSPNIASHNATFYFQKALKQPCNSSTWPAFSWPL